MPYGYIKDGAAVEASRGFGFTTTQLVIADQEEADFYIAASVAEQEAANVGLENPAPVVAPTITPGSLIEHPVQHAPNALDDPTPEYLARFCIQEFAEVSAPPAGEVMSSRTLAVTNGVISVSAAYTAAPVVVPAAVSRLQVRLELLAVASPTTPGNTLLDDVQAAVDAQSDRQVKEYWAAADPFHRAHQTLNAMATSIGWSSDYLDGLFIAAALRS